MHDRVFPPHADPLHLLCLLTCLGAGLLMAGGLSYVVGCFGVTMAFNVPRNNRLARLQADSFEAAAYWPVYVSEWTRWNTVAAALGCVCAAAALAY